MMQHHPYGLPTLPMFDSPVSEKPYMPPAVQTRWNKNEEVKRWLELARAHPEWLLQRVVERPQSGTQLLFERKDGSYFKMDGYEWRRRKEGRLIREDHMKLKVNKQELISANYAHSAVVPTFHRRVYWLSAHPDIALVHYLKTADGMDDSEGGEAAEGGSLGTRIAASIRRNGLKPTQPMLMAELIPIFSLSMSQDAIRALCQEVLMHLEDGESRLSLAIPVLATKDCLIMLNDEKYDESAPKGSPPNRRNSCSSASRRGLSSMALARQPSAFSDSVDLHFIQQVDSACKREWPREGRATPTVSRNRERGHSRSLSGETHRSSDEPLPSDWSRPDLGAPSCSDWSAGGGSAVSDMSTAAAFGSPIYACPSSVSVKGGEKLVVVGGWYMRGHEYSVVFGDKRVKARLLNVGVLQVVAPPARAAGRTQIRVASDGVVVSLPTEFFYKEECWREPRVHLMQALADRVQLLAAAFNTPISLPPAPDERDILRCVHSLKGRKLIFPHLLSSAAPTRTMLHLAAALDADALLGYLVFWKDELPATREFDLAAEDMDKRTPLRLAISLRCDRCTQILAHASGASFELEREALVATEEWERGGGDEDEEMRSEGVGVDGGAGGGGGHDGGGSTNGGEGGVTPGSSRTKVTVWVGSDGRKIFDHDPLGGEGMSDSQEGDFPSLPLEISMDTDVLVPDSPTMANLFAAVTSPGGLDGCTREQLAHLARQLIDALPYAIKSQNTSSIFSSPPCMVQYGSAGTMDQGDMPSTSSGPYPYPHMSDHQAQTQQQHYHHVHQGHRQHPQSYHQIPQNPINPFFSDFCGVSSGTAADYALYQQQLNGHGTHPSMQSGHPRQYSTPGPSNDELIPPHSNHTALSLGSLDIDFGERELGEFFSESLQLSEGQKDPLQRKLDGLKLKEAEQREVYQAALVMQQTTLSTGGASPTDIEKKAATTIQSCYRRYKQYCYLRRLHNAAVVVQKHFRLRRANQKEETHDEVQEHPSVQGESICIQVPNRSLSAQHRAAATIQNAYRGHRKRQKAARMIQKFMRQTLIKHRRIHGSDAITCTRTDASSSNPPPALPSGQAGLSPMAAAAADRGENPALGGAVGAPLISQQPPLHRVPNGMI